jgi:hypothetical protein
LRARAGIATSCSPYAALRRQRKSKMRAEIQTIVDEIKQSVGLLRRHL